MLVLSRFVEQWFGDESSKDPNVKLLAIVFFFLFFLAATQDIAVDGWAIGMLQKRNVGYAATCNMVGQMIGFSISFAFLLMFESKDFCNEFIFKEPRDQGLITFSSFLTYCGVGFIILTLLIALFKHEDMELQEKLEDHPDFGVKKAYPVLLKIFRLKPIITLAVTIFAIKVCSAASDSIAQLKLIEYKIPKDKLAAMTIAKTIVQVLLPFLIRKWTTGSFPMNTFINVFPLRILMIVIRTVFIYFTPMMISNGIEGSYYIQLFLLFLAYEVSWMENCLNTFFQISIASYFN